MIIGLLGFIGSGKGTVGDILSSEYGYKQDSFARPLKDAVANIFGWDRTLLEGATSESRLWRELSDPFWSEKFGYPFTPRLALQLMGTEAGRNVFHKDVWVISLLQRSQNRNTVVTDVRFKNEVKALHDAGGLIVHVRRGPNPDWYEVAKTANGERSEEQAVALAAMMFSKVHSSEWDWIGSPVDHTIYNDGTLADLRSNVTNILTITP